jgi:hypothetical protein
MSATQDDTRLWHVVPRLDAPDRLFLLPAPVAKWLMSGVFSGPVVAFLAAPFTGTGLPAWDAPLVWLVWATGLLVGSIGAFWRPDGLHVGQWVAALITYWLRPRRAVWCPIPREGRD